MHGTIQRMNVSAHELERILEKQQDTNDIDFISVCSPEEYESGHIKGIRNIPLNTLPQHIDELKHMKKIYLVCISGRRSEIAAQRLAALGVTAELHNLSGGQSAWVEAGLPLETQHP